jgi:hypothetical protein
MLLFQRAAKPAMKYLPLLYTALFFAHQKISLPGQFNTRLARNQKEVALKVRNHLNKSL